MGEGMRVRHEPDNVVPWTLGGRHGVNSVTFGRQPSRDDGGSAGTRGKSVHVFCLDTQQKKVGKARETGSWGLLYTLLVHSYNIGGFHCFGYESLSIFYTLLW